MALNSVTQTQMWIPSSSLILGLAAFGLGILAWITAKDMIGQELEFFRQERRLWKVRLKIPKSELLPFSTRIWDFTKHLFTGFPDFSSVEMDIPEAQLLFKDRVRREIDKLAGRGEYHGQKEQL